MLQEPTLFELRTQLQQGALSSRSLTEYYLERIDALNRQGPELNAVVEVNPDIFLQIDQLEQQQRSGSPPGPLSGLPILLKDNIDTGDRMATTAGSLALLEHRAKADAFIVQRLRQAGALILGKTNLSEWANFRSTQPTSAWSSRAGQTRNPYVLDRTPWGSSAGSAVAVAANLCAAAIGTETDGSIVYPAAMNSLVGLKPTVGLCSRSGIIPLSHSQDTPGPLTRSVSDAALLLNVLTGADVADPACRTAAAAGCDYARDYTAALDRDGLRGARLGVTRQLFPLCETITRLFEQALDILQEAGASLIELDDLPDITSLRTAELTLMTYELKAGLNTYLAELEPHCPVHSLEELIAFNESHHGQVMPWFGQERLQQAAVKDDLTAPAYQQARQICQQLSRAQGIDRLLKTHRLDAIISPTACLPWTIDPLYGDLASGGCATLAAAAGYPHITVPAGFAYGLPAGLSFFSTAWQEATLIRLAYAFEQHSQVRQAPTFLPTLSLGTRSEGFAY